MPTYNLQFRLKDPKATVDTSIYLRIYYKNNRFTYYLGEKIHPDFWNKETQLPIVTSKDYQKGKLPEYTANKNREIAHVMNRCKTEVEKILAQFSYQGAIPSPSVLKTAIDQAIKPQALRDQPVYLIPYINEFIERSNNKYNTVRNYKTTLNHLKKFEEERGKRIRICEVDLDLYDDLVRWFNGNNTAVNTLGTHIKNLKVFLASAKDRNLDVNEDFRKRRFKVVEETTDSIYLTIPEINRIANLDFTKDQKLERVRDHFIIGCYTGLRFSDYNQVNKENIQVHSKGEFLKVRMAKTGAMVAIPLRVEVLKILKRYDYKLPRVISNQKMNEHIKSICKNEKAKLSDLVNVTTSKGSLQIQKSVPKHSLITTHTARRSFATNAFLSGVPTVSLMKITGHKTEKSFLKYIRISQEENAIKMADHPYFIGQLQIAK